MLRVRGWMWGLVWMVGAAGGGALAQQRGERAPAESVGVELRGLASRAGVVFVGQVQKVEPKGGVVEVTLAVQQPVLGVVGGTYVMREWAGRWTDGEQRYWVGERAMFFLHAPRVSPDGEVGLSSPVDGMMGVVPVVPMGANGSALLDVRWLASRVRRAVGAPMVDASMGAIALADAVTVTKRWQTDSVAEPKGVRLPMGVLPQPEKERVGLARMQSLSQAQGAGDAQR